MRAEGRFTSAESEQPETRPKIISPCQKVVPSYIGLLGLRNKNINTRVDMSDLRNHWITTKALLTVFNILKSKNK